MTDDRRTIDQRRAEHARTQIRDIETREYGHYVSYVSALPATIVMNGIGQALLTLLAKAKGNTAAPHYFLYSHVATWLKSQIGELNGDTDSLVERLAEHDQHTYLRAQVEAMAYLQWLKQFARAYLKEKEGQDD